MPSYYQLPLSSQGSFALHQDKWNVQENEYCLERHKKKQRISKNRKRASYQFSIHPPKIQLICSIQQRQSSQFDFLLKSTSDTNQVKKVQSTSNETKNITKNYGKAIISFILKNKKVVKQACLVTDTPYQQMMELLPQIKKEITTMKGFRNIWTIHQYSKFLRVISCFFLKKNSLNYIFNSKVSNIMAHVKYRSRFLKVLKTPNKFDHIKEY